MSEEGISPREGSAISEGSSVQGAIVWWELWEKARAGGSQGGAQGPTPAGGHLQGHDEDTPEVQRYLGQCGGKVGPAGGLRPGPMNGRG